MRSWAIRSPLRVGPPSQVTTAAPSARRRAERGDQVDLVVADGDHVGHLGERGHAVGGRGRRR